MNVDRYKLIFLLTVFFTFAVFLPGGGLFSFFQSNREPSAFSTYLPMVVKYPPRAAWVPLGFSGEKVTDLHIDPDLAEHAYVSVFFVGLFETYDGGNTWAAQPVLSNRINDIAVHPITPTTMYVGTWITYGVHWTQNGGVTWEPIPGWSSLSPLILSVDIHPITPTVMLAGSGNFEPWGGHIFKSVNGGQSWYIVSPMFTNAIIFAFDPISPNIIYAGTQYRGVYKSVDAGTTWSASNDGLPVSTSGVYNTHVILHPESPQKVYAATSPGVYMSIDGAENWQGLWEGVDANFLLFDPQNPSTVYLGADDGIYVSYDTGVSWFPVGQCGAGTSVTRLAFDPNDTNVIWAGTTDGLWQCIL